MNTTPGIDIIGAERLRQITGEGYNASHDAKHELGELSEAATCYAVVGSATVRGSSAAEWPATMLDGMNDSLVEWPWDEEWWKPSDDPVRNFAKAGALIAAEIDRIVEERGKAGLKTKIPVAPSASQQKKVGSGDWLDELLALYPDADAAKWLTTPHKLLDGKTAFQAIRDGEGEKVARITQQLTTGAFI